MNADKLDLKLILPGMYPRNSVLPFLSVVNFDLRNTLYERKVGEDLKGFPGELCILCGEESLPVTKPIKFGTITS